MAGIYLHIPFCKKRCIYCDFYSTTESEKKDLYIQTLCKELVIRNKYLQDEDIETIYWGGGTPSQLSHNHFEQVFQTIYDNYNVVAQPEITLEANPDDFSLNYISMLRTLPFNRISMGVQTFNEQALHLLNRRHTGTQAIKTFNDCRKAGFSNISIDLIYGLPGEDITSWEKDLDIIIDLRPEHISAYSLIYEEGTVLFELRKQHKVIETDEDLSLQMFEMLMNRLKEAGYRHYEISNFCLPNLHSRHNTSYWTGKHYLGCGPSAHSYNGLSRQWNIASLNQYIKGIREGTPIKEKEILTLYTRYNDYIITRIRTDLGISLDKLQMEFGEDLYLYCLRMARPHLEQGLLKIEGSALKLTKKGIFVSDGIMSDMLWVDDD